MDERENMLAYQYIGQLFDGSIFNQMIPVNMQQKFAEHDYAAGSRNYLTKPAGNPQLRSNNKDAINQLIFCLHQRKSSFLGEIRILLAQKKLAEKLIENLNKEYDVGHD